MCECTYDVYTKGSNFRLVVRPNPRRPQIDVALLPKEKMRGWKKGLGIHKNKTRTSELRIRPPSRVSWPSSKTQLRESSFARRELATMSPERPAYVCVCNEVIRTRRIKFANRKPNWILGMSHTYPHRRLRFRTTCSYRSCQQRRRGRLTCLKSQTTRWAVRWVLP